MPPQNQSNPAQANEDSVKAFMALDEGGQTRALAKMSPEAKNWLLLGVRALKSAEPPEPTPDKSVPMAFVDRAIDTAKGIKGLFAPATEDTTSTDIGKGMIETYKEGGRQTAEQFRKAARNPDPQSRFLQGLRGATTGMSLLDPFATGNVADINRMDDEGRINEALGAGAFDILMLTAGGLMGRKPSAGRSISKLTSAIGETGESVKNLERTLPDLFDAAKTQGKPQNIGDFKNLVRSTLDAKEAEFRSVFDPIKHRRAYTPIIKNHIDRILRENPNLMKTPEGQAEVAALRRIQRTYDKPWTLEDMSLERSRLRKQMRSLYDAKPTDAAAKLKLDAELKAKKVVADSFSETVNDHLAHITGKPREYYDILRQKQEALMDLNDHLDKEVEKLRDKQAAKEGRTLGERLKPHAYVSHGGARAHIPFGEAVPAEGASDVASRKVRQAFGPTKNAANRRIGVLALPLSHLVTAGTEAKKSRTTPPPSLEE
jgi:hypothetical protein